MNIPVVWSVDHQVNLQIPGQEVLEKFWNKLLFYDKNRIRIDKFQKKNPDPYQNETVPQHRHPQRPPKIARHPDKVVSF